MGHLRPLFAALLAASLLAAFPQGARADDADTALPAKADVGPMRHLWQSLNNCGPASVVMALSTFGRPIRRRPDSRSAGRTSAAAWAPARSIRG